MDASGGIFGYGVLNSSYSAAAPKPPSMVVDAMSDCTLGDKESRCFTVEG